MTGDLTAVGNARLRGIVLILVVAVAAGAAGGAVDRWWTTRAAGASMGIKLEGPAWRAERRPNMEPGREREGTPEIPFALRTVKLTDEQQARIRAIVARWQPLADSLLREVRPRIIEMDFRMRQEAMCVLTPEQRTEWVADRRRRNLNAAEDAQMLALVTAGTCPADAKP